MSEGDQNVWVKVILRGEKYQEGSAWTELKL